ncbi:ABC transporter substrate-binding protein [Planosporangium mesophilum]|uniref:ABC transporter substrate-binding protein n=1 Tax=Planosporangium mesophilum TaxID=689768 RepID=A0A8J3TB05_9ACTN|nr:ABC transporter substrate-binding protein [Planosporangium mesophilum]NJC85821.1 carbohydrate ABC transporter substrate-binding protein [Planosporangium mesophilum]GII21882.1 ABC transporter substrate-binding protein [Planosporangium mesophilum]
MAQYPAGQSPAPSTVGHPSRRAVLRGSTLAAGAVTLPGLLAACGGGAGGDAGDKTVSFGSNHSDPVDKAAMEASLKAYEAKSGKTVKINTVSHNDFQTNISRYLQGNPDDVFSWFAGNRMQFFAKKGLAADISDIWQGFDGFTPALKAASTGEDNKQYFVPFYYYPWAVFYRKSVWQQRGYQAPKTWDEYRALAARMKSDGLIPISLGDKDGWPAMGTFDYIDMRLNGYDFHISLMAGKEDWTGPKVKGVFDTWKSILAYTQEAPNGRTWQEAANTLVNKQAGMHTLGMFVGQQFKPEELDDLDYFPYPVIDPANGQDAVEAPIDGFMVSKKAKNLAGAKDLMKFLAGPQAEDAFLKVFPSNVACHAKADTASYNALQKKAVELVSGAKHISQFMDRDTRPDFAQTVMIPAIQQFLGNPNDVDNILRSIEAQKKTIFAAE